MIVEDVLITSPEFIKSVTNIGDNISGKVLQTAIREAQQLEMQQVWGTKLLNKIKSLIANNTIELEENIKYKNILNESQYFLAYCVMANLIMITSFKIDNIGTVQTSDENIINPGLDDLYRLQDFYRNKADYYRLLLQKYLLANRVPELGDCGFIKSELYNAASSGLWLGGRRGK